MWPLLLIVAVAGSTGFATKRYLARSHANTGEVDIANLHDPTAFVFSGSPTQQDSRRSRASNNGVRAPKVEPRSEKRNGGARLLFRLKKREITKNVAANAKARFPSFKVGKAEINQLKKTMDETAKLVQELKSELDRRKLSHDLQNLNSVGNDVSNSFKIRGRNKAVLKNTSSELRDIDVKVWRPSVNDCDECGSSALTEEPEPQVLEMDQLEAELEFELQKLSGCTSDGLCHEKIKPNLEEFEPDEIYNEIDECNSNYFESHGVSASELHQKLSHLLIKQQEDQIMELESELHQSQSNLHEKEAELQALKSCVKRLTEISLSTISDDETEALTDPKGNSDYGKNNIDSDSKHSVAGTKGPIDYESCSCYL